MHLLIVSCTPRAVAASNTDKILNAFCSGFEAQGNTSERYYLARRDTWPQIRDAFAQNDDVLFALPLFVECVPGIMLEFLETLTPKAGKTKISFLLQGGFVEGCQLRCCEAYLETLPAYLGCIYNGTLLKGGMFGVGFVPDQQREKVLAPFVQAGTQFAQDGCFDKQKANEFAQPEYFSKGRALVLRFSRPLQKVFFRKIAKEQMHSTEPLDAKPFLQVVK